MVQNYANRMSLKSEWLLNYTESVNQPNSNSNSNGYIIMDVEAFWMAEKAVELI